MTVSRGLSSNQTGLTSYYRPACSDTSNRTILIVDSAVPVQ